MAAGLSDGQWIELGTVLKYPLISGRLRAGRQVDRETFVPKLSSAVAEVQARLDAGQFEGPVERALAAFEHKRKPYQRLVSA